MTSRTIISHRTMKLQELEAPALNPVLINIINPNHHSPSSDDHYSNSTKSIIFALLIIHHHQHHIAIHVFQRSRRL